MRRTGCGLIGHENDAEAPFADLLQELVRTDASARGFGNRCVNGRRVANRGCFEEASLLFINPQQFPEPVHGRGMMAAGLMKVGGALFRRGDVPGTVENLFLLEKLVCHGSSLYQSRRNPRVDPLTPWVK